jgi:hypothetical protein
MAQESGRAKNILVVVEHIVGTGVVVMVLHKAINSSDFLHSQQAHSNQSSETSMAPMGGGTSLLTVFSMKDMCPQ